METKVEENLIEYRIEFTMLRFIDAWLLVHQVDPLLVYKTGREDPSTSRHLKLANLLVVESPWKRLSIYQ